MNETSLRWKARIGALKSFAVLVLVFAGIGLIFVVSQFVTAVRNPTEPQGVAIRQLVDGTIGSEQYISVSGYAVYEWGYEETENGRVVATYYALLDDKAGSMVLVRAPAATVSGRQDGRVTISGMTRSTPSDLGNAIEGDASSLRAEGYETTSRLYVDEGAVPPSASVMLLVGLLLGGAVFLSIATFFFPSVVFAPRPVEASTLPSTSQFKLGVKATGRFLRLKRLQPAIEIGKGSQKFNNAIANIVPLEERRLMIYIHHILRSRYGIKISETDWGVFLDNANVLAVEPGKLYGWKDRWAVRFQYRGPKKPETLIVSFDHPNAQADFASLLQRMGFIVGLGMTAVV